MSYLLKMILYALIIFYVIRFFRKALGSIFGGSSNEQSNYSRNDTRRPEGEVRIEKNRNQQTRMSKDEGEYVDFEEVD